MIARTDKIRAMGRAKGQRKEQKRRQKLAFVDEYVGQIHRSSQILGCPKSFFSFYKEVIDAQHFLSNIILLNYV